MPAPALAPTPTRTHAKGETFDLMMTYASGDGNPRAVASIYASWMHDHSALPDWLGLGPHEFRTLMGSLFPGLYLPPAARGRRPDPTRQPEVTELVQLLLAHRAHRRPEEPWIAQIIAAACMGNDHLWQDLGLFTRKELTALIARNFPSLAAKNDRDMKWKRFFYKQLCETEGIHTCRSPSCEVCVDFAVCFGPEA